MARRVKLIQNNFTSGELSPRLVGRPDFARYSSGLREMVNWLTIPHGGARTRDGLHFINEVKDSTTQVRVIPFEFSTEQAYVIELGDLYARFYRNRGRIENPPSTPVEIVTPWVETQLFDIQHAQSADTLYMVHGLTPTQKITRTSHINWTITEVEFIDGPYLKENLDDLTITPSGTTGNITLTASAPLFQSGHVGALWRLTHGSTTGYVKVTGFTSSTVVNATVKKDLGATTATAKWSEGAWSTVRGFPAVIGFYENRLAFANTFHQPQTVWMSVTDDYENMTPGTNPGDAVTFTVVDNKVNAIQWLSQARTLIAGTASNEFSISGGAGEAISPTSILVKPQTQYGSALVQPLRVASSTIFVQRNRRRLYELNFNFDSDSYLAPDISLLSQHLMSPGLVQLAYQQEPDTVVWMIRQDGVLLALTYYRLQEIYAWSQHVTDGTFESVTVIPDPINGADEVWFVVRRTVGGVPLRYIEYFDPAAAADSILTFDGTVTTTDVTPSATTGTGVTFTSTLAIFQAGDVGKYIINLSGTGRALITTFIDPQTVIADISPGHPFPNTSPIPASSWGLGVTSVGNLGHLEGKTVAIVGDGGEYPQQVVSGGVVSFGQPPAVRIFVGLPFTSRMRTLPIEAADQSGTAQGREARWSRLQARVLDSLGVSLNGEELPFRSAAVPMGTAIPPFTGIKSIPHVGYDIDNPIIIEQTHPFAAIILAINGVIEIGDA